VAEILVAPELPFTMTPPLHTRFAFKNTVLGAKAEVTVIIALLETTNVLFCAKV